MRLRYNTSTKGYFKCKQSSNFIIDTFANAERYCEVKGWKISTIFEPVYTISDKDKDGIENPVKSDDFLLNGYELVNERGHGMAQAWIISKSNLTEVGYQRMAYE